MEYRELLSSDLEAVKALYEEACWTAYLGNDDQLYRAFKNSLMCYGGFDQKRLVGFIRCVGDGEHLVLVQDLLVAKAYQRQGIGKELFDKALSRYAHVRLFELNTDLQDDRANQFYRQLGLVPIEEGGLIAYFRKVRQ